MTGKCWYGAIAYRVIVNKIDRITQAKLVEQRRSLALDLGVMPEHILWVSTKKGTGIKELQFVTSGFLVLSKIEVGGQWLTISKIT